MFLVVNKVPACRRRIVKLRMLSWLRFTILATESWQCGTESGGPGHCKALSCIIHCVFIRQNCTSFQNRGLIVCKIHCSHVQKIPTSLHLLSSCFCLRWKNVEGPTKHLFVWSVFAGGCKKKRAKYWYGFFFWTINWMTVPETKVLTF